VGGVIFNFKGEIVTKFVWELGSTTNNQGEAFAGYIQPRRKNGDKICMGISIDYIQSS